MSTEKKQDINQLGKYRYPEIALANARIAELDRVVFAAGTAFDDISKALEIDYDNDDNGFVDAIIDAIDELKAQIASAQQQEPVGYQYCHADSNFGWINCTKVYAEFCSTNPRYRSRKLYAAPVIALPEPAVVVILAFLGYLLHCLFT